MEIVERPQIVQLHNLKFGDVVYIDNMGRWVRGTLSDYPVGIVSVVISQRQFRIAMKGSFMKWRNHGFPSGASLIPSGNTAGALVARGPDLSRLAVVTGEHEILVL